MKCFLIILVSLAVVGCHADGDKIENFIKGIKTLTARLPHNPEHPIGHVEKLIDPAVPCIKTALRDDPEEKLKQFIDKNISTFSACDTEVADVVDEADKFKKFVNCAGDQLLRTPDSPNALDEVEKNIRLKTHECIHAEEKKDA